MTEISVEVNFDIFNIYLTYFNQCSGSITIFWIWIREPVPPYSDLTPDPTQHLVVKTKKR